MKKIARKYPNLLFFVLSFCFSWTLWILSLIVWQRWFAPDRFPWWFFGSLVLGSNAPAIAAVIMAGLLHGVSGVKRLLQKLLVWRIGFRWYLAAVGIPTVGILAAMGIFTLSGGALGTIDLSRWFLVLLVPLFALPAGVVGEEIAWRGYALPALQWRYSALKSSMILGVLWALWHAPAYWAPSGAIISGRPVTPASVGFYMIFLIGVSIIMTWLHNNTRDNLPLAIIFHLSMNAGFPFLFFPDLAPEAMADIIYLCALPIWGVSLVLIGLYGAKSLSRQAIRNEAKMVDCQ
jgi:membrane protease YdiL (CAAX protease family)